MANLFFNINTVINNNSFLWEFTPTTGKTYVQLSLWTKDSSQRYTIRIPLASTDSFAVLLNKASQEKECSLSDPTDPCVLANVTDVTDFVNGLSSPVSVVITISRNGTVQVDNLNGTVLSSGPNVIDYDALGEIKLMPKQESNVESTIAFQPYAPGIGNFFKMILIIIIGLLLIIPAIAITIYFLITRK